jgi:hypothetical protein
MRDDACGIRCHREGCFHHRGRTRHRPRHRRSARRGRCRCRAQCADAEVRGGRGGRDRGGVRTTRCSHRRRCDQGGRGSTRGRYGAGRVRAHRCVGERSGGFHPQAIGHAAGQHGQRRRCFRRRVAVHHGREPDRGTAVHARNRPAHACATFGEGDQHRVVDRASRRAGHGDLHDCQDRAGRVHPGAGARMGALWCA